MGRSEDLLKADRAVKDYEIRFQTATSQLATIEKELKELLLVQKQLEENVKILKKNKIIAVAAEYKKAKADLKRVVDSSLKIKNDMNHYKKSKDEAEMMLLATKNNYEKLLNDVNNVLEVQFGRKNGQK